MLYFSGQSPINGATDIQRTAPIYFEIWANQGSVADKNSINVTVNGSNAIINGQFQANFSGSILDAPRGYDVYIIHVTIFNKGAVIPVAVSVKDNQGVEYTDDYSFTIVVDDTTSPAVIANPKGKLYASAQDVSLISSKPNTSIYYTTNGLMPDVNSSLYSIPIHVSANMTLKFFGIDEEGNKSPYYIEIYKFTTIASDTITPITTPNVAEGTYTILSSIILTSNKPATIYWSLNGANPTVGDHQNKDTSPVTVNLQMGTNVIRFFAVDQFNNAETLKVATYNIQQKENNVVATNVFVSTPYIRNTLDICWDDMMPMESEIVGYNIYRSQVGPRDILKNITSYEILTSDQVYTRESHTFLKLNQQLITTTFYRDKWVNRITMQEDVSDQFRFKSPIDASTDFNGQIVNADQWELIDPDRIFNQSDGLNFIDVYGNNREATFQSRFRLKGDFNIESGYELLAWPVTDALYKSEAALMVAFNNFTYVKISRIRHESFDEYVSQLVVNSEIVSEKDVNTTDMSGKFMISRSGADVTTFYYDGSRWILMDSYLSFSTSDLQVKYYVRSSNTIVTVRFADFTLSSCQACLPLMTDPNAQYCIQVQHAPIVNDNVQKREYNIYTDNTDDVEVLVDGQKAFIKSVDGIKGVIVLDTERKYDDVLSRWVEPIVPTTESIVTVTYKYIVSSFRLNLTRAPFYKVTCVLSDGSETRLEWSSSVTIEPDKLDYMYIEAIRRNAWLLDQAGERVMLFIRKTTGQKCKCYVQNERTHKQPQIGPCKICWGTGYVGGYEGPYEMKIAPCEVEQKINMTERGMKLEAVENTWTNITPTITQRDFLLHRSKLLIYSIGPVKYPEVRGVAVQQHFPIEHIDATDIRYEFIQSLDLFKYKERPGLRPPFEHYTEDQGKFIQNGEITEQDRLRTDKGPDYDDAKGRTITIENINF